MVLLLRGAGGVVTSTCVLKSFRFRSARFSRVALVLKPWPFFCITYYSKKISWAGTPGNSWWGWAAQFFNSWPYFKPKKIVIFHALFQSWPLGRNYVIEFANISFSFLFINLELKRQIRSYTAFFPSKTIPNSKPKWAKCIPVFRPKKCKNHILWVGTFKGIFPGKKSRYLKNFVRGPGSPLNASFGRDVHFEKERIDLKGSYWTKQYKGKYKFGRLSSVNEKEMIFILANMVAD